MEQVDTALDPATLTRVESSNIYGYKRDGNTLIVAFKDGSGEASKAYSYNAMGDDDRETFDGFEAAESKGRFFAQRMRDRFSGARIPLKQKDEA